MIALQTIIDGHIRIDEGVQYTVDRIVADVRTSHGLDFGVALVELDHRTTVKKSWGEVLVYVQRKSLRYASLPSSLTGLLNAKPVAIPELVGG